MPGPQKVKTNTKEESRSVRNIATNNFAVSVLATTQTEHSASENIVTHKWIGNPFLGWKFGAGLHRRQSQGDPEYQHF